MKTKTSSATDAKTLRAQKERERYHMKKYGNLDKLYPAAAAQEEEIPTVDIVTKKPVKVAEVKPKPTAKTPPAKKPAAAPAAAETFKINDTVSFTTLKTGIKVKGQLKRIFTCTWKPGNKVYAEVVMNGQKYYKLVKDLSKN